MEHEGLFQIMRHLDEPKRIIGLTIEDCVIGGCTVFLVMCTSSKILMMFAGIGIRTLVKSVLKGNSPSFLLLLAYWNFPYVITKNFIKQLPPSHKRYWIS